MDTSGHLRDVGRVVSALTRLNLKPVLVGGMALVTLGSRRVTRDFDFVVPAPGDRLADMVDALYGLGFQLAARVDRDGEIVATIGARAVAAIRLKIDAPSSAYFFRQATGLRIDLLFDFPIAANELAANATRVRIRSTVLHVASPADLLRLKLIARKNRTAAGDAEDIAFLKTHTAEH